MSPSERVKLTVYGPSSSERSSTIPSTRWDLDAVAFEVLGMSPPPVVVATTLRRRCLSGHGASAPFGGALERRGGGALLGEQAVAHREEARRGAARRVDLRVDVLDVVARGLGRDHQAAGD